MSVVRDEAANQIPSSDNEDSLLFSIRRNRPTDRS